MFAQETLTMARKQNKMPTTSVKSLTLHETFTRNKDDKNYTEAHHLIPYEQYDVFADKGLSLDRSYNIVSLCPNCHRNIHHGKKEDIGNLLEQLYKVKRTISNGKI